MITIKKTTKVLGDYVIYYSEDSAIDRTIEDFEGIWDEYLKTGDPSQLVFKHSEKPTEFKLRQIQGLMKRSLQTDVQKTMHEGNITPETLYLLAQKAIVEVTNLIDQETGKAIEVEKEYDKFLQCEVATNEFMDLLNAVGDGKLVNEIGLRAMSSMSTNPL